MAIFAEKKIERPGFVLAAIIVLFLLSYFLGILGDQNLFQDEGKYAVAAQEMNTFPPVVTLHGLPQKNIYPLFPALAKGLCACGLPMEFSLRVISIVSLLGLVFLVWFACLETKETSRNSELFSRSQAAAVAAAVMLSTILMAEKAVEGYPHLLTALILYAGWLIWFDLSVRLGMVKSDEELKPGRWSLAWVFVGIFGCLAFCCAGFFGLLCFTIPLIVQQRPLGIRSKLKHNGFWVCIGLIIFCIIVLWGAYLRGMAEAILPATVPDPIEFTEYLKAYPKKLFLFPLDLICRFFPWSMILWVPFCSLLVEQLDPNPLFGKFHRTLFVVLAVLIWLNPYAKSRDLLYLVPVFAVLVGQFYWIVIRRYGRRFSDILFAVACTLFIVTLVAGVFLCDNVVIREHCDRIIQFFLSLFGDNKPFEWNKSSFTCYSGVTLWLSRIEVGIACVGTAVCIFRCLPWRNQEKSEKRPVWMTLLILFTSVMLLRWGIISPWRNHDHQSKREKMVEEIRKYLPEESKEFIVYKDSLISGLYPEFWYMKVRVKTADISKKIPDESEKIYVLSKSVPAYVERDWNQLCEIDYKGKQLSFYEGIIRKEKEK